MDEHTNGSNGSGPAAIQDAEIIDAVTRRIRQRRERLIEIETEAAEHRAQLKRDERVISLLRGEDKPKAKPGPKPGGIGAGAAINGTKVGVDLLAQIEAAIRRYAEDHEEFRQVDIRKMPDTPTKSSGALATAFEKLRQDNVIRFVRQEGIAKVFRMTREAVTAEQLSS